MSINQPKFPPNEIKIGSLIKYVLWKGATEYFYIVLEVRKTNIRILDLKNKSITNYYYGPNSSKYITLLSP